MLFCPAVTTTTDWPVPALVVRDGAVQVILVADPTVTLVQLFPPTVTVVAPLMALNPVPVMMMLPPDIVSAEGDTLLTVAAAK